MIPSRLTFSLRRMRLIGCSAKPTIIIALGVARYRAGGFRKQTIPRPLKLADFHLKKLGHPLILFWEFGSDQRMRLGKTFRMGS